MPLPKKLLKKGVKDMVRISDARYVECDCCVFVCLAEGVKCFPRCSLHLSISPPQHEWHGVRHGCAALFT